ncbi:hypothetical protein M758_6G001500 [Ceratodon purpureus]|uniref:Uncharacterized protein n=1 Tax=Ceratodon purpureus TaxID=3225 RepID=A0A8T0H8D1_CERPU|nr:hypothetical protein KC19_6G001200 [Ceratodon purpureus]KAG0612100.1 hypothetical protein M758_6G001500 [Ceratodon purpureus]
MDDSCISTNSVMSNYKKKITGRTYSKEERKWMTASTLACSQRGQSQQLRLRPAQQAQVSTPEQRGYSMLRCHVVDPAHKVLSKVTKDMQNSIKHEYFMY